MKRKVICGKISLYIGNDEEIEKYRGSEYRLVEGYSGKRPL
jgi:hypothetical protein